MVSQIFILLISNGEKILSNVNVVVRGQVKIETSSLPVAVRVVLKLTNIFDETPLTNIYDSLDNMKSR